MKDLNSTIDLVVAGKIVTDYTSNETVYSPEALLSRARRRHYLRSVAKAGRGVLKGLTTGSEGVRLRSDRDRFGRYAIQSNILNDTTIRFKVPPLNFYEFPWVSKTTSRVEKGRYIVTKKFPALLNPRLQSFVDRANREILQKDVQSIW